MIDDVEGRPNPDELLRLIQKEESVEKRGKLKIFFGMCAGVGKTYAMLQAAHVLKREGLDVVVGLVETHKRQETEALVQGLEVLPRMKIPYRSVTFEEMDIDAILQRNPQYVLVDELAHTNVPGSRHAKRYQDVTELLDNGINVLTTVNVQHIESRSGTVTEITGIHIHETVPDSFIALADEIELIDISTDDLLKRLEEGKVYIPERAQHAVENFFRKGNLHALRELSLRITAEKVDDDMLDYMRAKNITGPWKTTEKLMVAVGPSPYSAKLIRWTRRMAYNLGASWLAVCVDTGHKLSEEDRNLLNKNIELSEKLGATIIHVANTDVVDGLLQVGKEYNVSQIVVGKTLDKKNIWNPFSKKNISDRLIQESGNIDIYAIKADKSATTGKQKRVLFEGISFKSRDYTIALTVVTLVSLICFPLSGLMGYQTVGIIFLIMIAVLSLILGRGPVILTAFLNFLIWNYFFIPPLFTFHIQRVEDVFTLFAYFLIAMVSAVFVTKIRKNQIVLMKSQQHITMLNSMLEALNRTNSIKEVAARTQDKLQKYFSADAAILLKNKDGKGLDKRIFGNKKMISEKNWSVASWVFNNGQAAGRFTDTLSNSDIQVIPLTTVNEIIGVLCIKFLENKRPDHNDMMVLHNFVGQVSTAIEREINIDLIRENEVALESQKLFQTVLNSVSHELRTPISIISSAISNLNDEKTAANPDIRSGICEELNLASKRLNVLVENILDMSKIDSGYLQLNLQTHDISDLIGSALNDLRPELSEYSLKTEVQDNLPMLNFDFNWLKQALVNVIHNAIDYSPTGGEIVVKAYQLESGLIQLEVSDSGKGVPDLTLDKLFDKFYRIPGSKTGGMGLGLTIAKAIVEAHGGTISAQNCKNGGLKVIFLLKQ
ncbi:MAG: sensor histidine kinase KdpD [Bacteroidota bacterium]|nr:sensor histidine kinase KdpD [Bacteroidota bacterium]